MFKNYFFVKQYFQMPGTGPSCLNSSCIGWCKQALWVAFPLFCKGPPVYYLMMMESRFAK